MKSSTALNLVEDMCFEEIYLMKKVSSYEIGGGYVSRRNASDEKVGSYEIGGRHAPRRNVSDDDVSNYEHSSRHDLNIVPEHRHGRFNRIYGISRPLSDIVHRIIGLLDDTLRSQQIVRSLWHLYCNRRAEVNCLQTLEFYI